MSPPAIRVIDEADGRWRRLVLEAPPSNVLSLPTVVALGRNPVACGPCLAGGLAFGG